MSTLGQFSGYGIRAIPFRNGGRGVKHNILQYIELGYTDKTKGANMAPEEEPLLRN